MVKVIYDPNSVTNAKNSFKLYNETILDSLDNINNELLNIDRILNTPASNKGIPEYLQEYNGQINFITQAKEGFDSLFDAVQLEYEKEVEMTRKMVGTDYEEK